MCFSSLLSARIRLISISSIVSLVFIPFGDKSNGIEGLPCESFAFRAIEWSNRNYFGEVRKDENNAQVKDARSNKSVLSVEVTLQLRRKEIIRNDCHGDTSRTEECRLIAHSTISFSVGVFKQYQFENELCTSMTENAHCSPFSLSLRPGILSLR